MNAEKPRPYRGDHHLVGQSLLNWREDRAWAGAGERDSPTGAGFRGS